jgi:PAS domain S-box-containing protein
VIEDATEDERVRENPATTEAGVRSYLAVPLTTGDGHVLGTLCVVAFEPRRWDTDDIRILDELAAEIVRDSIQSQRALRASNEILRESEARFQQLVENLPSVFWVFNQDFSEAVYISPAYETVFGRSLESIHEDPKSFLGAVHPDDLGAVRAAMAQVQREALESFEYRVIHPDGSVRWVASRGAPVRDRNGHVHQLVGITDDDTERKQGELKLAAAEAHYRRLVEHAPYAIYALDRQGRFTELSPATDEVLGYPAKRLIGKTLADLIVPEDLPKVEESVRSKLAGEVETSELEFKVVHGDAEPRLLHSRSTAIREAGEVVGIHGIARDITEERKRHEERRLLAAALENLREGVSISRFDGQIVYANTTHARLLGYDLAQRPLPNTKELTAEKEKDRLDRVLRIVAEEGIWTGRVRRRRLSDGQVLPMEVIFGRVDRDGDESLLFSIARDVSEEVERERHLRRAERLASVGTLLGGVAHELNNPLHAIQNFAALLVEEVEDEGAKEDLRTIQREAVRAARIVSDLRLLARGTQEESGERASIDLNDIVRHVLNTRKYSLETKNVDVRVDLAPTLPPILADGGQFEQVLLNLVVNAEQAMENQAGDRRLIVRTRVNEAGASLHVIDSGPGIPVDHLDRIFDPFWTTKTAGEGTGLGLSLVHGIITDHGGEIHVESEPGKGTAFRIELPGASTPAAPDAPEKGAEAPVGSLRILVVDDEPAIRGVFSRYLTRRGHQVDAASDGAEAIRLLRAATEEENDYDVVVSDLRMPGLGGEDLYNRLEVEGRGLERRILFMTGDAVGGDAARILAATNAPVLYKPMSLDEAAERIERHAFEIG